MFSISAIDYQSIKVVDDYLYLIDENKIQKVSLSRKKKHELFVLICYYGLTIMFLVFWILQLCKVW